MFWFDKATKLKRDKLVNELESCDTQSVCKIVLEIVEEFKRKYGNREDIQWNSSADIISITLRLKGENFNRKIRELNQDDFSKLEWLIYVLITPVAVSQPSEKVTYTTPEDFIDRLKKYN